MIAGLGWEDPLEKGMATHSSILAWKIPWTEEPGGLQSMGSQRDKTERLILSLSTYKVLYLFKIHQANLKIPLCHIGKL